MSVFEVCFRLREPQLRRIGPEVWESRRNGADLDVRIWRGVEDLHLPWILVLVQQRSLLLDEGLEFFNGHDESSEMLLLMAVVFVLLDVNEPVLNAPYDA